MPDDPDRSSVSEAAPVYSVPQSDDRLTPFNPRATARRRGVMSLNDTELLALIVGAQRRPVSENSFEVTVSASWQPWPSRNSKK